MVQRLARYFGTDRQKTSCYFFISIGITLPDTALYETIFNAKVVICHSLAIFAVIELFWTKPGRGGNLGLKNYTGTQSS